jgi:hypothetical protein
LSTKSTIAHGENFHFYHEIFEEDFVYLSLQGVEFTAYRDQVTVSIPLAVWEVIRKRGGVGELDLADKTDEELQTLARESGADEAERAEALEDYTKGRERERALRDAIQKLEEKNFRPAKSR